MIEFIALFEKICSIELMFSGFYEHAKVLLVNHKNDIALCVSNFMGCQCNIPKIMIYKFAHHSCILMHFKLISNKIAKQKPIVCLLFYVRKAKASFPFLN